VRTLLVDLNVKFILEQATTAQRGSRAIDLKKGKVTPLQAYGAQRVLGG
jgi:hypothetical protein